MSTGISRGTGACSRVSTWRTSDRYPSIAGPSAQDLGVGLGARAESELQSQALSDRPVEQACPPNTYPGPTTCPAWPLLGPRAERQCVTPWADLRAESLMAFSTVA